MATKQELMDFFHEGIRKHEYHEESYSSMGFDENGIITIEFDDGNVELIIKEGDSIIEQHKYNMSKDNWYYGVKYYLLETFGYEA